MLKIESVSLKSNKSLNKLYPEMTQNKHILVSTLKELHGNLQLDVNLGEIHP